MNLKFLLTVAVITSNAIAMNNADTTIRNAMPSELMFNYVMTKDEWDIVQSYSNRFYLDGDTPSVGVSQYLLQNHKNELDALSYVHESYSYFGCIGQIKFLLGQKYDVFLINALMPGRVFALAARDNHQELMEYILNQPCAFMPETDDINKAFANAARHNHKNIIEWMLTCDVLAQPNQEGINAILSFVEIDHHVDIMEFILSKAELCKPNQDGVNHAFQLAANKNRKNIMEWMLTCDVLPQPDQKGVGYAMVAAVLRNNKEIVEWLLGCDALVKPSQHEVLSALQLALRKNNRDVIECLLTQGGLYEPSQDALRNVFRAAIDDKNFDTLEWILNDVCSIQPHQEVVNDVFRFAADQNQYEALEWILSNSCPLKPDQDGIDHAFSTSSDRRNLTMMSYLLDEQTPLQYRPSIAQLGLSYRNHQGNAQEDIACRNFIWNHLPEWYRQLLLLEQHQGNANGQGRGIAFEIHDYAHAVLTPVMAHIRERVASNGTSSLNNQEIQHLFNRKGRQLFSNETQDNVFRAISVALSPEYMSTVSTVLHFVNTCHPHTLDLWIESFIGESITAYQNSINALSCSKGIEERIVTALRVLNDDGLNPLFAGTEGNLLFNKKLGILNLAAHEKAYTFATSLYDAGVRFATVGDVTNEQLENAGLTLFADDDLTTDQVSIVRQTAVSAPVGKWKPALKIIEDRIITEQQNQEYEASVAEDVRKAEEKKSAPLSSDDLRKARLKRLEGK